MTLLELFTEDSILIKQKQHRSIMLQERLSVQSQPHSQPLSLHQPSKSAKDQPKVLPPNKEKPRSKKIQKISKQPWNITEQRRYLKFLWTKSSLFDLPNQQRRKMKINVLMSKIVKSKTSNQCHSHHQKMVIKYGSIQAIIKFMGEIYELQPTKAQEEPEVAQLKIQAETPFQKVESYYFQPEVMVQADSQEIYIRYLPDADERVKQEVK